MNRFAWDLRYNDPIQIPGAFYASTGPKGPLAPPGQYQAKLTAGGKSQTASFLLTIDPRTRGAEELLQKQFALALQVNDCISQLHQAVNEIRYVRSQIQDLHKRFGEDEKLKPALSAADDLDHRMSEVEQQLVQVNMKGSEANLAFPNMLNERFDTFSHAIEFGDAQPTKPQLEVFQMLRGKLDEQLKKWAQIKAEDVPKVSGLIKQVDLPALSVKEKASE
jgi:seryl-tRNA synthetase